MYLIENNFGKVVGKIGRAALLIGSKWVSCFCDFIKVSVRPVFRLSSSMK